MLFDKLKAYGWMTAAIAAGSLLAVQSVRLHTSQRAHQVLITSTALQETARTQAALKHEQATAAQESTHATASQDCPMPSPRRNLRATIACALTSLALTACGSTPTAAPPLIARKPMPTPLSAAVLQIDLKPSTGSLLKALLWSENSEALLQSAMPK